MAEQLTQHDPRRIGPFEVLGRLGSGGMGLVYLARSASGRRVAIKTVRTELAEDQLFRVRFTREVEAARAVSGFYTAAVVDADPRAAVPWLATAYVPAPSLEEIVSECGPVPPQAVRWLAAGVAEALQSIHSAGLVHRDLKPSNVLVVEDGPRVIDFGIASGVSNTRLTMTNVAVGTPAYMSPEQARDSRGVTGASDVFSLASTLVFAATGQPPYHGSTPVETVFMLLRESPDLHRLPAELHPLIEACMRHAPEDRPTPADLQAQLAPHLFSSGDDSGSVAAWLPAEAVALIERQRANRRRPPAPSAAPPLPSAAPPLPSGPGEVPYPAGLHPAAPSHAAPPEASRPPGAAGQSPAIPVPPPGALPAAPSAALAPPAPDVPGGGYPAAAPVHAPMPSRPALPHDPTGRGTAERPPDPQAPPDPVAPQAPNRSAAAPVPIPPAAAPAPAAPAQWRPWRFRMSSDLWGSPIIRGGLLYVTSLEVHALAVVSGRRQFKTREVACNLAVTGGRVIASDGANLYALDATDGVDQWSHTGDGWIYSLATERGTVVAGVRGGGIQVREAANGELLWSLEGAQSEFENQETGPVIDSGTVFTWGEGHLYALEARTGRELWHHPVGDSSATGGVPVRVGPVRDGVVHVAAGSRVLALDAVNGTQYWRFDTPAVVLSPPVCAPGQPGRWPAGVYVVDYAGTVYALDPATGEDRWRIATETRHSTEPVVVNDGLVHLGSGAAMYTLDAASGTPRWRFGTGGAVVGSPVAVAGRVHFGSEDRCLYTVDAVSGRLSWKLETGGAITGTPAAADGMVFACSKDHCVYALDAARGTRMAAQTDR